MHKSLPFYQLYIYIPRTSSSSCSISLLNKCIFCNSGISIKQTGREESLLHPRLIARNCIIPSRLHRITKILTFVSDFRAGESPWSVRLLFLAVNFVTKVSLVRDRGKASILVLSSDRVVVLLLNARRTTPWSSIVLPLAAMLFSGCYWQLPPTTTWK